MKKKTIIITLSIIILISIALIIYFLIHPKKENIKKKDYGELLEVEYSCSGDMLGNIYNVNLDFLNNKLTVENANMHSDPINVSIYNVDKKDITKIKNLVVDYNIPDLEKGKIDDTLFLYDACSPTLRLVFKTGNKSYDRKYYSISYYYNVDKIKRDVINEIRDNLRNLIDEDNLVSTSIKNDN